MRVVSKGAVALSLLMCSLAVATVLSAAPRVELGAAGVELRDGLMLRDGKPFSGITVERYPTGIVYRETRYDRGIKNGETRKYAMTGTLVSLERFSEGAKDGLQEGWYMEGPKRFELRFKKGVLDGVQSEWHLNGALFRKQIFAGGVESDKKILFAGGELFTNYAKRDGRVYGIDGGALCFEPAKREGEK